MNLDYRVTGSPGVLAFAGAVLAVQILVCRFGHRVTSIGGVDEMATRDADWPGSCGATDAVEGGAGSVGDGVAAPGDMMVGPDQHQIALVQCVGMILTDIDDLQWHCAFGCRVSERVDVAVGESQESKAQPE